MPYERLFWLTPFFSQGSNFWSSGTTFLGAPASSLILTRQDKMIWAMGCPIPATYSGQPSLGVAVFVGHQQSSPPLLPKKHSLMLYSQRLDLIA